TANPRSTQRSTRPVRVRFWIAGSAIGGESIFIAGLARRLFDGLLPLLHLVMRRTRGRGSIVQKRGQQRGHDEPHRRQQARNANQPHSRRCLIGQIWHILWSFILWYFTTLIFRRQRRAHGSPVGWMGRSQK